MRRCLGLVVGRCDRSLVSRALVTSLLVAGFILARFLIALAGGLLLRLVGRALFGLYRRDV
ncbi:MAG TPA: hypothetical protein VFH61_04335, partial [Thermoleophilia bacterium]|nr:hypothetical protein [Thermoleophilia bacterium]